PVLGATRYQRGVLPAIVPAFLRKSRLLVPERSLVNTNAAGESASLSPAAPGLGSSDYLSATSQSRWLSITIRRMYQKSVATEANKASAAATCWSVPKW